MMAAGNPNWWSLNDMRPLFDNQDFPLSWSQLLSGGLASEEERFGTSKKLENWENEQILIDTPCFSSSRVTNSHVGGYDIGQDNHINHQSSSIDHKQEVVFGHGDQELLQACSSSTSSWLSHGQLATVPLQSSTSSDILNFSSDKSDGRVEHTDDPSECNGTAPKPASKKAKVRPTSSTQPPLKVRKEKVSDRIAALHQLVTPFGKTDAASVLFESIAHIRSLQGQIRALSSPYLGSVTGGGMRRNQNSDASDAPKDLTSRGLCLVPVSCTHHINIGSDIYGANYWTHPALGGGF